MKKLNHCKGERQALNDPTFIISKITIIISNSVVNESETNTVCGESPCVDHIMRGKILHFEK